MVAAFEQWIDQASTTRLPGEILAVQNEIYQCTAPDRQNAHFAACGAALMLSAFPLVLDIPDSVLHGSFGFISLLCQLIWPRRPVHTRRSERGETAMSV